MPIQAEEVWQDIPGFPGYQASTHGRITGHRGIMKQQVHPRTRYAYLTLYRSGQQITRTVHSLVASTFLGQRVAGAEVNHQDGNKQNNTLANLEYVSRSENERHANRIGLKHSTPPVHIGERHHNAKITSADAVKIRSWYRAGGWSQRRLARHFHVSQQCIWNLLSGKTWALVA